VTGLAIRFTGGEIVLAGVLAGTFLAGSLMLATALLIGADRCFLPLRMVSAIALGRGTLDAAYSLPVAAITGIAMYTLLSVLLAYIFSAFVSPLWSRARLVRSGIRYGIAVWLLNLYVIAPALGWTWLVESGNPLVLFLAHAFAFGCPLGLLLWESRSLRAVSCRRFCREHSRALLSGVAWCPVPVLVRRLRRGAANSRRALWPFRRARLPVPSPGAAGLDRGSTPQHTRVPAVPCRRP
jgi:hypothetical protein